MKTVRHYNLADHEMALATAKTVLEDASLDYNAKRAQLQAVVKPLFSGEFKQGDCETIWVSAGLMNHAAAGLKLRPNPSNFVQRMNVKTLLWIIVEHRDGSEWPGVWQHVAETGNDQESFANPEISSAVHDENLRQLAKLAATISTTTTTNAAGEPATMTKNLPALPALGDVVDLIDGLVAQGQTPSDAVANLSRLYPGDAAVVASAESLRTLRGNRVDPLPVWSAEMTQIIEAAGKPVPVAAPVAVSATMPAVDAATAAVIDGVLSKLGLPPINAVIMKANEAASGAAVLDAANSEVKRLMQEVAEWQRKATMAPAMAPVLVPASGDIPAGTVVTKNAADLFGLTDPKKRKLLDFDVPVGEWVDASGAKAEHPFVPTSMDDFIFNLSTLVPILLAIVSNEKPWLRGHTGTGKTTVIEQVYARLNLPLYRVNLDSDISRSELIGRDAIKHDPVSGATITSFVEGVIPRAMQEPCGLLLDEVDASRPELTFVLQRVMEGKGFMLLEDGGRTIVPHPYFRIFATANTNGRGDETGLYTGTRVLGSAFVNRFGPFLVVDYIDQKSEARLVQMRAPTLAKEMAEQIVGFAKEHRVAFTQGQVSLPCSPRDTVQLAQKMAAYLTIFPTKEEAIKLAFDHVVFNAADNDDVVILKGLADRFITKSIAAKV